MKTLQIVVHENFSRSAHFEILKPAFLVLMTMPRSKLLKIMQQIKSNSAGGHGHVKMPISFKLIPRHCLIKKL